MAREGRRGEVEARRRECREGSEGSKDDQAGGGGGGGIVRWVKLVGGERKRRRGGGGWNETGKGDG